jgi:hypothetical protein
LSDPGPIPGSMPSWLRMRHLRPAMRHSWSPAWHSRPECRTRDRFGSAFASIMNAARVHQCRIRGGECGTRMLLPSALHSGTCRSHQSDSRRKCNKTNHHRKKGHPRGGPSAPRGTMPRSGKLKTYAFRYEFGSVQRVPVEWIENPRNVFEVL